MAVGCWLNLLKFYKTGIRRPVSSLSFSGRARDGAAREFRNGNQVAQMERLHYIDSLRALASLLIVIFHSSVPRIIARLGEEANHTAVHFLKLLNDSLEPVRMPLFFMIAGMMCAYGLRKYNFIEFVKKRVVRIIIPFVFAYFFLMFFVKLFWQANDTGQGLLAILPGYLDHVNPISEGDLSYLWFLFVLILYTSLALFLTCLYLRVPAFAISCRRLSAILMRSAILLLVALVSVEFFKIALAPYVPEEGDFANGRIPIKRAFWYANYFLFGTLAMHRLTGFHAIIGKNSFLLALLGMIILSHVLMGSLSQIKLMFPLGASLANIAPLLLVTTLAYRFLNRPVKCFQFMANYSYPVYILHVPAIAAMSYLLYSIMNSKIHGFLVVVVMAYPLSLVLAFILCKRPLARMALQGKIPSRVAG